MAAALTTLLASAAAVSAGVAERSDTRRRIEAKLNAAVEAAKADDCPTTAKLEGEVVDDKRSAPRSEELRLVAFQLAAGCEAALGRTETAFRHAVAGTAYAGASDELWRLRLLVALQRTGGAEAAIATIEAMTRGRGAALNGMPVSVFYELDNRLRKNDAASSIRRRLLVVLTGPEYDPDEPGILVDGFLHRRAELLQKDGDLVGAGAMIRRIVNPGSLIEISLDRRFRTMLRPDFDLRRGVEQALAGARTDATRHPDRLSPTIEVATYLRVLGRPQGSVDALEAVRSRIGDPAIFIDRDDRLVWWWDGLSRSYAMLGRYSEAVDALRNGGETEENGDLNVSQVINLSSLQRQLGRPAEALGTLAAFDGGERGTSAYGTMQIVMNRGCAKSALGTPADAAADLAFARAHVADAPDALLDLLLCTGDLDGAAVALVAQLDDPDRRAVALRNLSDYDAPPVALPTDPTDVALRLVKERPEVQAAIIRAGGTRRFRVQNVAF